MSKPKTLRLFLSPKLPDDSGQFSLSLDYPQECKIVMASSRYNELLAAEQELRTLKANADRLREFERACKAVQQAMKL